ncbi:MAG TPA: hypothetical protein VE890_17910 [Thermoguttaceae bacterium]|nr:hypothetical protein [Thermoguttaceae bacterium]
MLGKVLSSVTIGLSVVMPVGCKSTKCKASFETDPGKYMAKLKK